MKKSVIILVLINILCAVNMQCVFADESTASAYSVRAEGNFAVGQTVIAEYIYYDETDASEIPEKAEYQWYRQSGRTYEAISGAVNKEYTLVENDVGCNLYFTLKTANINGNGQTIYSAITTTVAKSDASATTVEKGVTSVLPQNPYGRLAVGDTAKIYYSYSQSAGIAEGNTQYVFRVKGENTVLQEKSAKSSYTIKQSDAGKWIEAVVYPQSSNGVAGTQETICFRVGNLFADSRVTATASGVYANTYPVLKRISDFAGTTSVYSYSGADVQIIINAGRTVRFDSFYIKADNTGRVTNVKIYYSPDKVKWIKVPTEIENPIIGENEISMDYAASAKYFRLEWNATANSSLYEFFPYLSESEYSDTIKHPVESGILNGMLTYSERIVVREATSAKISATSKLKAMTTDEFSEYIKTNLPSLVTDRPSFEIDVCRMAQLYNLTGDADYAEKVYVALWLCAEKYYKIVGIDVSGKNFDLVTSVPAYMTIAYDNVYNYALQENKWSDGDNIKACIEGWLYDVIKETYLENTGRYIGNLGGYGIKHLSGTAYILDCPEAIRWAISLIDDTFSMTQWHGDGMWSEGTISYGQQLRGNTVEAINNVLNKYKDPQNYTDELLNLSLNGTEDLKKRWDIIPLSEEVVATMKFPNGTTVAAHDTHFSTGVDGTRTETNPNLLVTEKNLKNIELNHFGLYGLKFGKSGTAAGSAETSGNAQQATLLFPPLSEGVPFSGGHYHGNFLTMSYWSAGAELLPDAGYPFAVANNRYFHMSAVTHNGSWIYNSAADDYGSYYTKWTRPNVLAYDDGSNGMIQLIEASQPMPEEMQISAKKRLLMMVKTSDSNSYLFDLQRLKGGEVHENFLRGSEDEAVILQTQNFETTETADNLGAYLTKNGMTGLMQGEELFTNAKIGNGETDVFFSLTGEKSGSTLNAFIKGNEDSTAAFSNMPSLRRTGGNASEKNMYPTVHFYQRRAVKNDEQTNFGGVYEGMKKGETAKVKGVSWKTPGEGDCWNTLTDIIAVVDLGEYEDVICISDNTDTKVYDGITFNSEIALVRRNKTDKLPVKGYIYGEGIVSSKGKQLTCETGFEAEVIGVNRDTAKGEYSVTLSESLPEEYVGKWSGITFGDNSGIAHEITGISENRVYLHNDTGFELSDNKAIFKTFPAKYNKKLDNLKISDTPIAELADRSISGTVMFKVENSVLSEFVPGEPILENTFEELTADTKYHYAANNYAQENVKGSYRCFWYTTDGEIDTDYSRDPYGFGEKDGDNTVLAVVSNKNVPIGSMYLQMYHTAENLDENGIYSASVKIKPDKNTEIRALGGKIGTSNGKWMNAEVARFQPGNGVFSGGEKVGNYNTDKWYTIEAVYDLKNMKYSAWIDGVKYVDGDKLTFDSSADKTKISPVIQLTKRGTEGESSTVYIDDFSIRRTQDTDTNFNKPQQITVELYKDGGIAEDLEINTEYVLRNNVGVYNETMCRSIAAVYRLDYEDKENSKPLERLQDVYISENSAEVAEIKILQQPKSYYDSGRIKTKLVVKAMALTDNMTPYFDAKAWE